MESAQRILEIASPSWPRLLPVRLKGPVRYSSRGDRPRRRWERADPVPRREFDRLCRADASDREGSRHQGWGRDRRSAWEPNHV